MKTTVLNIGDVIRDSYGNKGIVFSVERRPGAKWLAAQEDERVRSSRGPWWKVLPMDGGSVIVPDDLGTFVRRADIDDLLQLCDAQQTEHASKLTIEALFSFARKHKVDK